MRRRDRRLGAGQRALPSRAFPGHRGPEKHCFSSTRSATTAPPSLHSCPATPDISSPTHTPSTIISTGTAPSSTSAAGHMHVGISSKRSNRPGSREDGPGLDRGPVCAGALDGQHASQEAPRDQAGTRGAHHGRLFQLVPPRSWPRPRRVANCEGDRIRPQSASHPSPFSRRRQAAAAQQH